MCEEKRLLDVSKESKAGDATLERQRQQRIDTDIDALLGVTRETLGLTRTPTALRSGRVERIRFGSPRLLPAAPVCERARQLNTGLVLSVGSRPAHNLRAYCNQAAFQRHPQQERALRNPWLVLARSLLSAPCFHLGASRVGAPDGSVMRKEERCPPGNWPAFCYGKSKLTRGAEDALPFCCEQRG
jgi:hypothetical protein